MVAHAPRPAAPPRVVRDQLPEPAPPHLGVVMHLGVDPLRTAEVAEQTGGEPVQAGVALGHALREGGALSVLLWQLSQPEPAVLRRHSTDLLHQMCSPLTDKYAAATHRALLITIGVVSKKRPWEAGAPLGFGQSRGVIDALSSTDGELLATAARLAALICHDDDWAKLMVTQGALPHHVNPLQCAAARRTPHAAYSNIDHCARALQV